MEAGWVLTGRIVPVGIGCVKSSTSNGTALSRNAGWITLIGGVPFSAGFTWELPSFLVAATNRWCEMNESEFRLTFHGYCSFSLRAGGLGFEGRIVIGRRDDIRGVRLFVAVRPDIEVIGGAFSDLLEDRSRGLPAVVTSSWIIHHD